MRPASRASRRYVAAVTVAVVVAGGPLACDQLVGVHDLSSPIVWDGDAEGTAPDASPPDASTRPSDAGRDGRARDGADDEDASADAGVDTGSGDQTDADAQAVTDSASPTDASEDVVDAAGDVFDATDDVIDATTPPDAPDEAASEEADGDDDAIVGD